MSCRVWGSVGIALACAALLLPDSSLAKRYDGLPAEVRETAEPLDLLVVIPQQGLQVQYSETLTPVTFDNFGGPIGTLISGILARRELAGLRKKARAFDGSLTGFDVNALAMDSTRAAFAGTSWLRSADAKLAPSDMTMSDLRLGQATLTYEYAVDPSSWRVFVACALKIGGTDPATGWESENLRFSHVFVASIEWEGGASSKKARFATLTANNGERLRSYLAESFRTCAQLAKRRSEMSAEQMTQIRARPTTTITFKTGFPQQFEGWQVGERDGTVRGKYGMLGIGKTFTAPGTSGVLLLRDHGLWHNRVDVLPPQ